MKSSIRIATATAVFIAVAGSSAAQAQSATYAVDGTHTFAYFETTHFGTSLLRGRFDRKEGTVQFDRAGKTGRVELTIDLASVSTGVAALDKHLSGPDFFNAAGFPQARFVGEKFSFDGDKVTEVAGMLTMLGKAQPVALKAKRFNCYTNPMLKREVCGGDFETTIQRSQWGMVYGLPAIPDAVTLHVQVEAIRQ